MQEGNFAGDIIPIGSTGQTTTKVLRLLKFENFENGHLATCIEEFIKKTLAIQMLALCVPFRRGAVGDVNPSSTL